MVLVTSSMADDACNPILAKLRRTTYKPYDSAEDRKSGEAIATSAPNRKAQEPFDLVQPRESREAAANSEPNRQASEIPDCG
jgi:hypothetical protein